MSTHPALDPDSHQPEVERRDLLTRVCSAAMFGGLAAAAGSSAAIAARYLYPARPDERAWIFLLETRNLKPGESTLAITPSGEKVSVARVADRGTVEDFIALSATCPHLGCQVHWEASRGRFFCPCHNGTFDPSGKSTSGPPFEAGQSLSRYPLKLEGPLLYLEVKSGQALARAGRPGDESLQGGRQGSRKELA